MPAHDGDPVQLRAYAGDDFMSTWSPDGRRIAYYSYRDATRRIMIMSSSGEGASEVAARPREPRFPGWSPDGEQLVFHSDAGGRSELYVLPRRGSSGWGAASQLTTSGHLGRRHPPDRRPH
jgi:Tol biopolymer transport system component